MRRSLGVRGALVAVSMTMVLVALSVTPAPSASTMAVSPSPASRDLLALAELLPDPAIIHPDIARQVKVDLSGLGSLAADLSAARSSQIAATAAAEQGRVQHASLTLSQHRTQAQLAAAVADVEAARAALVEAKDDLGEFALGTFIGSSALDLESFSTDTSPSPIPTLAADAEGVLVGVQQAATQELNASEGERERLASELDATERALAQVVLDIERSDAERGDAAAEVARLEPAFESALLTAPVVGAGFPVVVLDAYYRAALRTAESKSWCEVRWDQLAGIGKVESGHGTFGGNTVGADGRTDGEILGPVLDGTRFASIPDTDGGRYDLDPVWDRAVGPMQFIPGSWVRYAADGNGDDEIDPHNMYDAAMAAANHLCGTTGGLADDANYQRALLGYNRSVPYGIMVMGFAGQYRDTVGLEPTSSSVADPSVASSVAALRSTTGG